MKKFDGVAGTLFVPLWARIAVSKKFPEYFTDEKALALEPYLPKDAEKGASEYSNLASVARYYNMDRMVSAFAGQRGACNVVYLGAGLETAFDRLSGRLPKVFWTQVDLPEVIAARREIFGNRPKEITIAGDMRDMAWAGQIDASIPTMLVISGVFQYFHEEEVIAFIDNCKTFFPGAQMIFDATSALGLRYTNWFIKRTGNESAVMHFGVDDSATFAEKCGCVLLEERTFFPDALRILRSKLKFVTRLSMKTAERRKMVLILRLKLADA